MTLVKKAVIPAAGMGTRFLPVTKIIPKELLPIATKPALQIVIEEAVSSGITDIILVTSPLKRGIENYFKWDTSYDKLLAARKKEPSLDELKKLTDSVSLTLVLQEKPLGLGHAVLCAKKAVGNEPFAVLLPDVLIESQRPCTLQLTEAFKNTGTSVNATEHTPRDRLCLYGVYDIESSSGRLHKARRIVEKPKPADAPSDLAVVGRYVFTPEVFSILEETRAGKGGEIQLADAMDSLAKSGRMHAYEFEGRQFDLGDKLGFLLANIYYGCKEFPHEIKNFMQTLK